MKSCNNTFDPTYLYLKRHNKTGLLYFGKIRATSKLCRSVGPEGYLGSGTYWKNHLKMHGNHVETLWYCLFTDKETLLAFATSMSEIMNVVGSKVDGKKAFANLIPENGLSGTPSGFRATDERRANISKNHWARGLPKELNPNTGSKRNSETRRKISESRMGNTWAAGSTKTVEARILISEMKLGKVSGGALDKRMGVVKEILKTYAERPNISGFMEGVPRKNGRILSYERAFANAFCLEFDMTSNGVYKTITKKTLISRMAFDELQ